MINNGSLDTKLVEDPIQNDYLNNLTYLKKLTDKYEHLQDIWDVIGNSAKGSAFKNLQKEGKIGQTKKQPKPKNERLKIPFDKEKNELVCIICSKNLEGQDIKKRFSVPQVEVSKAQRLLIQFFNPISLTVSFATYSDTDFNVSNSRMSLYPFKTIWQAAISKMQKEVSYDEFKSTVTNAISENPQERVTFYPFYTYDKDRDQFDIEDYTMGLFNFLPKDQQDTELEKKQMFLVDQITKESCFACSTLDKKTLFCSRCKVARYCSPDCQRAHWPTHKQTCQQLAEWKANQKKV